MIFLTIKHEEKCQVGVWRQVVILTKRFLSTPEKVAEGLGDIRLRWTF